MNIRYFTERFKQAFLLRPANRRALLVSIETFDELETLCTRLHLDLNCSNSLRAALESLRDSRFDVIVYDQDLPAQDWRTAISALARTAPTSSILLLSRSVQLDLWNDVVRKGGHDVLIKPLAIQHAESTLALACARAKLDGFSRQRRIQVW